MIKPHMTSFDKNGKNYPAGGDKYSRKKSGFYFIWKNQDTISRIIKLIISLFLFAFDGIMGWFSSLFNKETKARCVILYYHAVYAEEKESFICQINDLVCLTNPISIQDIGKMKPGERYSIMTFDDGFACILENAIPELLKRNIPSTIFIPSDCLGRQAPWLNEKNKHKETTIMTENQLNSLNKSLILIGSHGRTHKNFLRLTDEEAKKEIVQSKKDLEKILKMPVEVISFPHGDFSQTHIDLSIQAGYRQAYSIIPETIYSGSKSFVQGRIKVDPSDWHMEYRLKLLGAYRWLPIAFGIKKKLF